MKGPPISRRAYLLKLISDVRASYWFIPGCLMILAIAMAQLSLWLDANSTAMAAILPSSMVNTQIDGARAVLSVIAQAVLGVAGVMFSITMVAVSYAAGQFGPRLIGNFMRDRGNQWSLGILIATFVYALIVLRETQARVDGGTDAFVPQLSLIVAMGLALISVATVIYYVHHVPETINVANITSGLGRRFIRDLTATARDPEPRTDGRPEGQGTPLCLDQVGYIQRVDIADLAGMATSANISLHLESPPGAFILAGRPAATVFGEVDGEVLQKLCGGFALGPDKSEDQNLLFIAEQQVEMIARALSPGINDPHTAMDCMNWLAAGLAAADRAGTVFGLAGKDAVSVDPLKWTDLFDATFMAALPYVQDDAMAKTHWDSLLDCMANGARPATAQIIAKARRGAKA